MRPPIAQNLKFVLGKKKKKKRNKNWILENGPK